jgi:adenylosuccinate synthase
LDFVALNYAVRLNGCEHLAVTKADVLTGIDPLKVCVAYSIDGTETTTYPASANILSEVVPVYDEVGGWSEEIQLSPSGDNLEDLPGQLREYLSLIERSTGIKVALVSVGPDRAETFQFPESSL